MMNPIIWQDMEDVFQRSKNWEWLRNKRVMVTGAYGMLASYVVFFLIYLNESFPDMNLGILAVGRSKEKLHARFGEYCDRKYFFHITQNICEPLEIDGTVDYIVHAASYASSNYYGTDPVGTLMPNTIGTYHLLELSRAKKTKGFLFFSSGDIYGILSDMSKEVTEQDVGMVDPMILRNCYGESKRMGENMCKAWMHQYGVAAMVVRLGHTYGPTMDIDNDPRVFAEFIKNVLNKQNIVMKSDGSATRSFCYLADALDGFFTILKKGTPGEAYNLYNDQTTLSIKELANVLSGLRPEYHIQVVQEKRSDESNYIESLVHKVPNIVSWKLKKLGWTPRYDIKCGFERTLRSFEEA